MPKPYPILYAPTLEAREAARKVLALSGIYWQGSPRIVFTLDWCAMWGKERTHIALQRCNSFKTVMWSHVKQALDQKAAILVNSPHHFIAYLKTHGMI